MSKEDEKEIKDFLKSLEDMGETMAKMTKSYYDNLIKQGFSKKEALNIISRCEK